MPLLQTFGEDSVRDFGFADGSTTTSSPGLYSFPISAYVTFNGAVGANGPSYSAAIATATSNVPTPWTSNTTWFNTFNGQQQWAIPSTGTYQISIAGAQGGNCVGTGGLGAIITATFTLTSGQIINMMIGQRGNQGYQSGSTASAGGAGGTFITTGGTLLLVAGGGGGGGGGQGGGNGNNGSTSNGGTNGNGGAAGPGGTSGNAGGDGGGNGSGTGQAGAGYSGNASTGGGFTGGGGSNLWGYSFLNGGQGGIAVGNSIGAFGGFGGGSCGYCNGTTFSDGGGGAGGYSGGGSGGYNGSQGGGGGGSYVALAATNIFTSNGLYNGSTVGNLNSYQSGTGFCTITRIS